MYHCSRSTAAKRVSFYSASGLNPFFSRVCAAFGLVPPLRGSWVCRTELLFLQHDHIIAHCHSQPPPLSAGGCVENGSIPVTPEFLKEQQKDNQEPLMELTASVLNNTRSQQLSGGRTHSRTINKAPIYTPGSCERCSRKLQLRS